jgi:hypothetical protein
VTPAEARASIWCWIMGLFANSTSGLGYVRVCDRSVVQLGEVHRGALQPAVRRRKAYERSQTGSKPSDENDGYVTCQYIYSQKQLSLLTFHIGGCGGVVLVAVRAREFINEGSLDASR